MEQARRHEIITELYFLRGCPVKTMARLLDVPESQVSDDLQLIREQLVEASDDSAEGALAACEEIPALANIAHHAMCEFSRADNNVPPLDPESKALFLDTAARCFFYIGRLKQGRDE